MTVSYKKIRLEFSHNGQILKLVLNAPKGNILDIAMMGELTRAVSKKANNSNIKGLIFEGAGDHFSFGASVQEHRKEYVAEMLAAFRTLLQALIQMSKPMFALVRGQCLGGGLELAAFCNWIFACPEATFGQPEIKLGVFPPFASLILPYRIGQSAAEDLILTGRSIDAETAQKTGLVFSVSGDPEAELADFIETHILPKSTAALSMTLKAARFEMHWAFLQHIDSVEKLYLKELMSTHDANEGVEAFLKKRKPDWKNR